MKERERGGGEVRERDRERRRKSNYHFLNTDRSFLSFLSLIFSCYFFVTTLDKNVEIQEQESRYSNSLDVAKEMRRRKILKFTKSDRMIMSISDCLSDEHFSLC